MQSFNVKRLYDSLWYVRDNVHGQVVLDWRPVYVCKENLFYKENNLYFVDVWWVDLALPKEKVRHSSIGVEGDTLNENYWRPMPKLEAMLYKHQVKYARKEERRRHETHV